MSDEVSERLATLSKNHPRLVGALLVLATTLTQVATPFAILNVTWGP